MERVAPTERPLLRGPVGLAQRLLIALASLSHQPARLIADKPTSAPDPTRQAKILKLFAAIHAKGTAPGVRRLGYGSQGVRRQGYGAKGTVPGSTAPGVRRQGYGTR